MMMKRFFLQFILLIPLLIVGCKKDKVPEVPKKPNVSEATLPIVFHVLYESASNLSQNPDKELFIDRLKQLNDFLKTNTDAYLGEAIDIKFTFATHNPEGTLLSEPGVNRVYYAGSSDMDPYAFLNAKRSIEPRDREILWDPNQYINIWLISVSGATAGAAYIPYTTSENTLDLLPLWDGAITQQPNYMHGIILDTQAFAHRNYGMFLICHEIGHYLGLLHPFGESCSSFDDASDDGCSDTPIYSRYEYEYLLNQEPQPADFNPFERKRCDDGKMFLSTNLMDYEEGDYTNITLQQYDRMEHVIVCSPWIPRSATATKALLENFSGEITDQRPDPVMISCPSVIPFGE